jgi:hypothetical protein
MLITYRRTGGVFSLIMIAVALVAVALAVVVGATLLAVGVALGAVVLLVRAVLPQSWRRSTPAAATPWPQETIEGTIVKPEDSSDEHDLLTDRRT